MRRAILLQRLEDLQDDRHTRLVIAAEDGRAVGEDDAVADLRLDAHIRADGVHMGAEHQPVAAAVGEAGDQVVVLVAHHLAAERGEALGQVIGDGLLLARWAVDGDQVEKGLDKARFIDHEAPQLFGAYQIPGSGRSVTGPVRELVS